MLALRLLGALLLLPLLALGLLAAALEDGARLIQRLTVAAFID